MIYQRYVSSPLGVLQIRCNDSGIRSVLFVEEGGEDTVHHPLLDHCGLQLREYFEGNRNIFDLPLAAPGTTFQQSVWRLLQAIPFGKTLSYQQLARQYGDLKAIRAVASANGRNPLTILVPCHRVIGSNRSLTGYSGGLWRKRWLLEHEARHYGGVQELAF